MLQTLIEIFFIGATILMIYEIVRIIWVNIEKYNKREPKKDLFYLRHCSKPSFHPINKPSEDLDNEIGALKQKISKLYAENKRYVEENNELLCHNKSLLNDIERLKDGVRSMEVRHSGLFTDWRKEVLNNEANETRIKELEAALARAEGLNRSLADGGLVNGSVKPQNIQL